MDVRRRRGAGAALLRGKAGEYQRHFIAELDPELQARALADFRWQLVTGAVVESVDVVGTVVVRRQARCDVRGQRPLRVDPRARFGYEIGQASCRGEECMSG